MSTEIKKSGTKLTVKRPAPQSPANVRNVDERNGRNGRHTHSKAPRGILAKLLGLGG